MTSHPPYFYPSDQEKDKKQSQTTQPNPAQETIPAPFGFQKKDGTSHRTRSFGTQDFSQNRFQTQQPAKPTFGPQDPAQTHPPKPSFGETGSFSSPKPTFAGQMGFQAQKPPLNSQGSVAPKPSFGETSSFSSPKPTFGGQMGFQAQKPAFNSQGSVVPKPNFGTQSGTTFVGGNKHTFGTEPGKPSFGQTAKPMFSSQAPKAASPFTAQKPAQTDFKATASSPFGSTTSSFQSQAPRGSTLFGKDVSLSDNEFHLIRDFIYNQCGIFIAENRKYLVENRLSNRIRELNLKSYSDYYKYLKFDANKEAELNKLFVLMTTNETSFFRNPPQLQVFQNIVLSDMVEKLRPQGRKLRIWSAGCSTGEEPYTLAIIISEVLKDELNSWNIKITANDLSTQVLAAARNGIYNEYSLRTTPKELVSKYFTQEGKLYKIKDNLKRMVSFGQINLNNREQLKAVERSHIVFCRNVIIYFDDEMKRKVINSFYDNLLPNGVLLIGHSESLHNICRSFELEHHTGTIVYRKQA